MVWVVVFMWLPAGVLFFGFWVCVVLFVLRFVWLFFVLFSVLCFVCCFLRVVCVWGFGCGLVELVGFVCW